MLLVAFHFSFFFFFCCLNFLYSMHLQNREVWLFHCINSLSNQINKLSNQQHLYTMYLYGWLRSCHETLSAEFTRKFLIMTSSIITKRMHHLTLLTTSSHLAKEKSHLPKAASCSTIPGHTSGRAGPSQARRKKPRPRPGPAQPTGLFFGPEPGPNT